MNRRNSEGPELDHPEPVATNYYDTSTIPPATVTDVDDALAFVQSENNARRHQSKGSLAASWALSMLAANKRDGGRWAYRAAKTSDLKILDSHRSYLGVIADHAPHLLIAVRDDSMSLNAAYTEAERDVLARLVGGAW